VVCVGVCGRGFHRILPADYLQSYAGQYVPNIAHYILNNMPNEFNLVGLALGNACWGGDATNVECNGPNSDQNDIDM